MLIIGIIHIQINTLLILIHSINSYLKPYIPVLNAAKIGIL